MKKRIAIIALVILCVAAPMFAASDTRGAADRNTLGVGLNLGTNTGVGLRYGYGPFDVIANIGLDLLRIGSNSWTLSFDVGASYQVHIIDGGRNLQFPITVGAIIAPSVTISDHSSFNLSVLIPGGIEYTFDEVPVTAYFRLAPGIRIMSENKVDIGFAFGAFIGALWNFDL